MPNSIMYQEDYFVVLAPDQTEQFVTLPELKDILKKLLLEMQTRLPQDLQNLATVELQIDRLINTVCDLDCYEQGVWQWYVVRLQKNEAAH